MQMSEVEISGDNVVLKGILAIPKSPLGIVAFAHGSGSGRLSPRNQEVARRFERSGLATLLFDLLTDEEHQRDLLSAEYRFDIALLARRLALALEWLRTQKATASLPVGLFGASTGAAAALVVAADYPDDVCAVVSRGGRPDLAHDALPRVEAPTLLIVGGLDEEVIGLNGLAAGLLRCEHRIAIVPDATHLFEEPGALEQVARLAVEWFVARLAGDSGSFE
ncbi:dienelactone hydrolase family protein [Trinickia fusca]|uniref:Alpha/beta hydrolase n=1 Tax=Trinickia fusca TaxID=2419777 RepID=A0A494XAA6_9BURK|nr:dienelactone hydrolase family protein [Trinickia fusca]RKP44523.1 alpha/beta hydrolase [Trinickia fusca]